MSLCRDDNDLVPRDSRRGVDASVAGTMEPPEDAGTCRSNVGRVERAGALRVTAEHRPISRQGVMPRRSVWRGPVSRHDTGEKKHWKKDLLRGERRAKKQACGQVQQPNSGCEPEGGAEIVTANENRPPGEDAE